MSLFLTTHSADYGYNKRSIKNRKRMKTERNLLHKVSVKLFLVYRKDGSIWYSKNHKFRKWYFGWWSGVKRTGIVVINKPRISNFHLLEENRR